MPDRAPQAAPGPQPHAAPPGLPAPPPTPGRPWKPGSGHHRPRTGIEHRAAVEAARLAYSENITRRIERIKNRLGVDLTDTLPAWRSRWEHPGCRYCDRGFVDAGRRVRPCRACRAARAAGGDTR